MFTGVIVSLSVNDYCSEHACSIIQNLCKYIFGIAVVTVEASGEPLYIDILIDIYVMILIFFIF